MTKTLRIDIISDVMCPWCIVGYRQLSAALEATGTAHEIHWHPFELNPDMPPEGQNLREHIMQKYGSSLEESEQSRQHLKTLGLIKNTASLALLSPTNACTPVRRLRKTAPMAGQSARVRCTRSWHKKMPCILSVLVLKNLHGLKLAPYEKKVKLGLTVKPMP